jgi:Xaa-Pro dipeptidase
MSLTAETLFRPTEPASHPSVAVASDRRTDVEGKQARVAALLQEVGCEGLLVLEPENFSWLTSGATARGILNPAELPALYFSAEQRWLISSNVDSQRLFDEELNELGFQLKEWPWHWGREQLIADLAQGRRLACDRPLDDRKTVGDRLRVLRRALTAYELACYLALGQTVSHALEATCRNLALGETEREVAGHLTHRLIHRGIHPAMISVAADGRSRLYRQAGFTAIPISKFCVISACGAKYGLYATASRTVCFGESDEMLRKEHDAACKVCATYVASGWPDSVPRDVLHMGRKVYQVTGFEHEWAQAPQGHVTGRSPVEMAFYAATEELLQPNWAVTWRATVGAAVCCDTFFLSGQGPRILTPAPDVEWPLKRIRVMGAEYFCPDVLYRDVVVSERPNSSP